jgi:hypothetical protein
MKTGIARMSLILSLATILAAASGSLAASTAEAQATRIPIVNYFISCEQVAVERVWVADGVKHVRDRRLVGEVRSTAAYHSGPATNVANANVVLATLHGTFHGQLDMRPDAYPDGWWNGSFSIQGLPGHQTGTARLKGYGSLAGYYTKTTVTHMSGQALHGRFPEACGGLDNVPVGGSVARGYMLVPGGE